MSEENRQARKNQPMMAGMQKGVNTQGGIIERIC